MSGSAGVEKKELRQVGNGPAVAVRRGPRPRLGEVLIEQGFIDRQQLEAVLREMGENRGQPLGSQLVQRGMITDEELARSLARQNGLPFVSLREEEIDPETARLVSERMARSYKILPLRRSNGRIRVALADPTFTFLLDTLRLKTGFHGAVHRGGKEIEAAIEVTYNAAGAALAEILASADESSVQLVADSEDAGEELDEDIDQAPVIKLVDHYISHALRSRASDIHIEPRERDMRVRFRIDGVLHEVTPPPKRFQNAVISRLKIMSELDISERRRPQDGRFKIRDRGRVVDFRVSSLPTVNGEKIVIRILDAGNLNLDLTGLGFSPEELNVFQRSIRRPYGMILVTGPTGSGKTTTLYSALATIAAPDRNIVTVEDPVEYRLDEINQVQARPEIGLSFADGLRSILRQDPDVIMIGEIRDLETAEIAVKAALTGHLVLSTLHTNDAAGTLIRLTDMGIPGYLVTASVNLVVAQRLTRRVCVKCRQPYSPDAALLASLGLPPHGTYTFYNPQGCPDCNGTGYRGRVAVYELLEITSGVKRCINQGMNAQDLKEFARQHGMRTLRDSGLRKVMEGVTTVEEVLRVTFDNEEMLDEVPAREA
ncbi:Flp pilus assembly complex ATPase component TadA [bacterium]|nr:Flp pilus assembly complex ATPase component TadA [bacterium]